MNGGATVLGLFKKKKADAAKKIHTRPIIQGENE